MFIQVSRRDRQTITRYTKIPNAFRQDRTLVYTICSTYITGLTQIARLHNFIFLYNLSTFQNYSNLSYTIALFQDYILIYMNTLKNAWGYAALLRQQVLAIIYLLYHMTKKWKKKKTTLPQTLAQNISLFLMLRVAKTEQTGWWSVVVKNECIVLLSD